MLESPLPPWRRGLIAGALALLLLAVWVLRPDQLATDQVDAGWKRALATFAVARALNAVVSVVQGTEVAVQPAGMGVTLAPGQVLDPINDLIEQFSTLMLAATAAFAAQRLLIEIGAWWPLALALSAAALAAAARAWQGQPVPRWLVQALLALLVVRFAVPAVVLASEATYRLFMAQEYTQAQASLERAAVELDQAAGPEAGAGATEPLGWKERIQRRWSQATDVRARFEDLKNAASDLVEHIVRLIVVFTLQTVVLPLLFGWALWRLLRNALDPGRPERGG
jgi:hypothetical protein